MELCHDDRRSVHESQQRSAAESRRAKHCLAERASKSQQGSQELLKYRAVAIEGARFLPRHRIEFHQQFWGSFETNSDNFTRYEELRSWAPTNFLTLHQLPSTDVTNSGAGHMICCDQCVSTPSHQLSMQCQSPFYSKEPLKVRCKDDSRHEFCVVS